MFEVCVFHRLKGCFCELIENNRKVPLRKISGTFWTIPVETGVCATLCAIWWAIGPKVSMIAVL